MANLLDPPPDRQAWRSWTAAWDDGDRSRYAALAADHPAAYYVYRSNHGPSWLAEEAIAARKLASPINHVAKGKPPILILASETDVSAPLPNAERMCKRMLEAGQDFEFENWPEEVSIRKSFCAIHTADIDKHTRIEPILRY